MRTALCRVDWKTEYDYSVYAMRQASRRSWRIGQIWPVRVVFMSYRSTLQADALKLVARKLQSSLAVEGELPEDGLATYSDDGDDLIPPGDAQCRCRGRAVRRLVSSLVRPAIGWPFVGPDPKNSGPCSRRAGRRTTQLSEDACQSTRMNCSRSLHSPTVAVRWSPAGAAGASMVTSLSPHQK